MPVLITEDFANKNAVNRIASGLVSDSVWIVSRTFNRIFLIYDILLFIITLTACPVAEYNIFISNFKIVYKIKFPTEKCFDKEGVFGNRLKWISFTLHYEFSIADNIFIISITKKLCTPTLLTYTESKNSLVHLTGDKLCFNNSDYYD